MDPAALCLRPVPAFLLSLPLAPNQLKVVEVGLKWGEEKDGGGGRGRETEGLNWRTMAF